MEAVRAPRLRAKERTQKVLAAASQVRGYVLEDGGQGPDAKGLVVRDRDVVLAASAVVKRMWLADWRVTT